MRGDFASGDIPLCEQKFCSSTSPTLRGRRHFSRGRGTLGTCVSCQEVLRLLKVLIETRNSVAPVIAVLPGKKFSENFIDKKQLARTLSISESYINKLMVKDGLPYR